MTIERAMLLAIAALCHAAACATPPKPPLPDPIGEAAAAGMRLEPWSREHSEWLGMHCELATAGNGRAHITKARGNIVLVVDARADTQPQWTTTKCDEPNWGRRCGAWMRPPILWIGYQCEQEPPWPRPAIEEARRSAPR
jgi:hypothetical protein